MQAGSDLFHIVELYRPSPPDVYTEELVVVKCCAPQEANPSDTKYTNKSAAMFAVIYLTPPINVNWTQAACECTRPQGVFSAPCECRGLQGMFSALCECRGLQGMFSAPCECMGATGLVLRLLEDIMHTVHLCQYRGLY